LPPREAVIDRLSGNHEHAAIAMRELPAASTNNCEMIAVYFQLR